MRVQVIRLFAGFGLALCLNPAAIAGQTVITGSNGRQGVVNTECSRSSGITNCDRTVTYPSGQTSTSNGSFSGSGGNYSGTVNRTNRRGNSNTYQVEGQRSRGNGTYQNNATITGPQGYERTVDVDRTCNDGQCNGTRTVTFPNGKTRTRNTSGTRTAPGTYEGTINVTGRNGRQRSGSFTRRR